MNFSRASITHAYDTKYHVLDAFRSFTKSVLNQCKTARLFVVAAELFAYHWIVNQPNSVSVISRSTGAKPSTKNNVHNPFYFYKVTRLYPKEVDWIVKVTCVCSLLWTDFWLLISIIQWLVWSRWHRADKRVAQKCVWMKSCFQNE